MPDVAGVVITHGTDTIEETAYFLNLVVKIEEARRADRRDAPGDGALGGWPAQLLQRGRRAREQGRGRRGVLVVINDWIHGAASLTKTSTTPCRRSCRRCRA
jgi:L-asparaginase